jgi:hypothetical protein
MALTRLAALGLCMITPELNKETFYRYQTSDYVVMAEMFSFVDDPKMVIGYVEETVKRSLKNCEVVSIWWEKLKNEQFVCHGTGWQKLFSGKPGLDRVGIAVVKNVIESEDGNS